MRVGQLNALIILIPIPFHVVSICRGKCDWSNVFVIVFCLSMSLAHLVVDRFKNRPHRSSR